MENKQRMYLDKVVEFLVRDTRIDYDKDEIQYPFPFLLPPSHSLLLLLHPSYSIFSSPFSKYCKNVYGLTEDEVKYVWNQYKDIILDKISNK